MSFYSRNNLPPIGVIVAWLKNFSGVPSLSGNWVECNGQTITDAGSPYYNIAAPAINSPQSFLMGFETSGETTGSSDCHCHCIYYNGYDAEYPGYDCCALCCGYMDYVDHKPPYYEVVYVMRIK
jgi:hypothetical protein